MPSEPECDDGLVECAGDVGRVCLDGAWIDFDCASFVARCVPEGDGRLRCVEAG